MEEREAGGFSGVAVSGSPNTVMEVRFDVRASHLNVPLLGTLLSMGVEVDGLGGRESLTVIGQVSSVETRNRWHEDASMKNCLKIRGELPHLTRVGDVTEGVLQVVGAYRSVPSGSGGPGFPEKTRLSVPPGSGIRIDMVDPTTVEWIMSQEHAYGYLGKFYGTEKTVFPVLTRHFGDKEADGTGGSGESYMGCVFGPSGSGKSVKAAELIVLWAQHPEMGILVLDPAGEFSGNAFGGKTGFEFDFHAMMHAVAGKRFDPAKNVVGLDMLQLEDAKIFVEILKEKGFFRVLGGQAKIKDFIEGVIRFLENLQKEDKVWDPSFTWGQTNDVVIKEYAPGRGKSVREVPFSEEFTDILARAYAGNSRPAMQRTFRATWVSEEKTLSSIWEETAQFFRKEDASGRPKVNIMNALSDVVMNGAIWIFNLNPKESQDKLGTRLKFYVMDLIFKRLRNVSHKYYNTARQGNCLVVMDEAGRFVPQTTRDDDEDVRKELCHSLVESTKELRKMRVGFMFVTQGIAEIHKEIFRNTHYRVYGVGLGVGADGDHIRDKEGNEAFELYRTLPEPRLSGSFSFLVSGVLLALGSSGRPMVVEGFRSGSEFLSVNAHIVRPASAPLKLA